MRQKRVAAIHDISGVGKCSLTVALPIISVAGIECSVIPTAVLSTHTGGFGPGLYATDLTESILPIANHWKSEGFYFDAIYSGYLGSIHQVDILAETVGLIKGENTLVVVDPVMGDNGKLYQSFSPEFPAKMLELCKKADIITPNVTEACLMLGEDYLPPPYKKEYLDGLLKKLSSLCGCLVVITGAALKEDQQGAAAFKEGEKEPTYVSTNMAEGMFHGTGDIFSSVFVSAMVKGLSLKMSLKSAVDFTRLAIENTKDYRPELWYGVNFEEVLSQLPAMLEEKENG